MSERHFRELHYLTVTGTHRERTHDLLRRIKAELPALKEWLLVARPWRRMAFIASIISLTRSSKYYNL